MKFYNRKKMIKGLSKYLKKNTYENYYRLIIKEGITTPELDNKLIEIIIIAKNSRIIDLKEKIEELF